MGQAKQYDREYKEEALKLVEEKGCKNASEELGIPYLHFGNTEGSNSLEGEDILVIGTP